MEEKNFEKKRKNQLPRGHMKDRILAIRKYNHMKQEEFAEVLGINRASVSYMESGKNDPSATTFRLICIKFHVREEWLLTGEGEMLSGPGDLLMDRLTEEYDLTPLQRKITENYLRLSVEDREDLSRKLRTMFNIPEDL